MKNFRECDAQNCPLDAVGITCDLSPTGRVWQFDTVGHIPDLVSSLHAVDGGGRLFTPGQLLVDGPKMKEAIAAAVNPVDIATVGRVHP